MSLGNCKDEECVMKTFITAAILSTSLALSANAAMVTTKTATHFVHANHVATVKRHPVAQREAGPPNFFQALFGLPIQVTPRGSRDLGEYVPSTESPTYDTSPPVDVGAQAEQSAADAAQAAATEELNDSMALTASVAAADAQNAADTAATIQTEINAGM
jgi:hypothetical protein